MGPTSYNILIKALLLIWEALWLTVSRAPERRGWTVTEVGILSNTESKKFFQVLISISINLEAFHITEEKNIKGT